MDWEHMVVRNMEDSLQGDESFIGLIWVEAIRFTTIAHQLFRGEGLYSNEKKCLVEKNTWMSSCMKYLSLIQSVTYCLWTGL